MRGFEMKSQCFLHLQNHSVFSTLCKISTTNVSPLCTTTVTPRKSVKIKKGDEALMFKASWLASLTSPPSSNPISSQNPFPCSESDHIRHSRKWVLGVDPDTNGALAILQFDDNAVSSAQVFDSPHLKVMIGERVRKRLDANSIVQLIRSLDAPLGAIAHIEQSNPFPKDGKQGWWSGGFGYGLWIGVLVSSGFSVVPVPCMSWKKEFELAGGSSTKDDSRRIASELFPSLSTSLKRKKDHGRAEALLIAAYGKGLKPSLDT